MAYSYSTGLLVLVPVPKCFKDATYDTSLISTVTRTVVNQHFKRIRIRKYGFDHQKLENYSKNIFNIFFMIKKCNLLIPSSVVEPEPEPEP